MQKPRIDRDRAFVAELRNFLRVMLVTSELLHSSIKHGEAAETVLPVVDGLLASIEKFSSKLTKD